MSTEFKLEDDWHRSDNNIIIALRFWGGADDGQTVRFAFPREVMFHLKDVKVFGCNGEETTLGALFDKCNTADFIAPDVNAREHLAWGTDEARRKIVASGRLFPQ
tara:strand:- start:170 stop:484 length:315 start_codon:yes stop_codon:yes gene_type:complete